MDEIIPTEEWVGVIQPYWQHRVRFSQQVDLASFNKGDGYVWETKTAY